MLILLAACARRDPLAIELQTMWSATHDTRGLLDHLRTIPGKPSEDVQRFVARALRDAPEERWLAEQILACGPEILWTAEQLEARKARAQQGRWPNEAPIRGILAESDQGRPIEALYVPGLGPQRALVISGVHGSEQSGIEAVERLVETLQGTSLEHNAIIVPVLFPDNAAVRTREGEIPTNRNFPPPGEAPEDPPLDALGRPILTENLALIALVDRFRPERIASVHATVRPGAAGIFSDPHTTSPGEGPEALAEAEQRSREDEALALAMASYVAETHPESVPGNALQGAPLTTWSGGVDGGTSLGGWGPRAIGGPPPWERPSIGVITVEVADLHRSSDLAGEDRAARLGEIDAFADALREVFLGSSAWESGL